MKALRLFAFVLALFALLVFTPFTAFAQTDTPTSTPTNTATSTPTHTPVTVATSTAVPTSTPIAQLIRNPEGPAGNQGAFVVSQGDVTVSAATSGGNSGSRNEFIGRHRSVCPFSVGTMTNGSTESTIYLDDSPTGEWATLDANDVTLTADTAMFRLGTTSLKMAFKASSASGDGAVNDITNDNLESNEFIGGWFLSSETITAGDLALLIHDTSDDTYYLFPKIAPGVWTWVEFNITDLASGRGDVVDKVSIVLTTQGAGNHAAFSLYADEVVKWDATDEEALSLPIVQDGVEGYVVAAVASGTANTTTNLVEGTGYVILYRPGNDSLLTVTDQSANYGLVCFDYE